MSCPPTAWYDETASTLLEPYAFGTIPEIGNAPAPFLQDDDASLRIVTRPSEWRAAAFAALILAAACGQADADIPLDSLDSFERNFVAQRELTLAEDDNVINVDISVSPVDGIGFFVADAAEAQLRAYDFEGRLLRTLGSRGAGPGEFRSPVAFVPFAADSMLAVDRFGRLTVYSAEGDIRTVETQLFISTALAKPDGSVLIAARRSGDRTVRLFAFHPGGGEVVDGPVVTTIAPEMETAFATISLLGIALRGPAVLVTIPMSDSVYLSDPRSGSVIVEPLPFRGFRVIEKMRPHAPGMAAIREWLDTFSLISQVYSLSTGEVVVQYQDRPDMLPRWRLLVVDSLFNHRFEMRDSPRLLAVMPGDTLVFQHPQSETPNRWLLVTLR